jgi:iron complex transport system substrate-binding protein
MKKRITALLTALALAGGAMISGCGSSAGNASGESSGAVSKESAAESVSSSTGGKKANAVSASGTPEESVGSASSSANNGAVSSANTTKVITDSMGNQVEIPEDINSLVILPMPWISVVYALNGNGDIITGMQQVAKDSYETSILKELAPELENTDTTFFTDGEFNYEELAKINPDVVLLFESQSKHIDKLKEVGIPSVTIKYADSYDTLWNDFKIVGEMLGKQDRAQKFIDYQKADVDYFKAAEDRLEGKNPVKVMQIYTIDSLSVADNSGVNNDTISYVGGTNVGESTADASSETEVNMEQVYAWDPDVILLSNFDDVVPEDLYNNTIDGQDWSQVSAVKNHRVYKIPQGIYRWDADCPCTETTLCMKWLAKVVNPEIFSDINIRQDTKDFYKSFFNYDLTDEQLDKILATDANAASESID